MRIYFAQLPCRPNPMWTCRTALIPPLVLLAMLTPARCHADSSCNATERAETPSGDPYSVLGVACGAHVDDIGISPVHGTTAMSSRALSLHSSSHCDTVLSQATDADKPALTKAYRALARRWHPDKAGGNQEVSPSGLCFRCATMQMRLAHHVHSNTGRQVFAAVARAYDVLTDPEKREIFDRLGEDGLQRLQDGDPSVKKGPVEDARRMATPDSHLRPRV